MLITPTTKYAEFVGIEKYLKDDAIAELKKASERAYVQMYELTLADFLECCNGTFNGVLGDLKQPTVLQVYWCKRFKDFAEEFANALKGLQLPRTPEEILAGEGLPKQTFSESMLTFGRNYFGLPNFKEAEKLTLGDLLIAKRDTYIGGLYQRKLHKIQMQKYKGQKK